MFYGHPYFLPALRQDDRENNCDDTGSYFFLVKIAGQAFYS
uniref:Uncharacterized protein n=1 Tax=Arundo donax TaxID=35708 RepID=A0A0A8Z2V3_ARUDO